MGDHDSMTFSVEDDWSPADNPYAIAVSQSQLWREVVLLTIRRMRDEDDRGLGWFSSKQLDAHVLVLTLRQIPTAAQMEQAALKDLGVDPGVRDALAQARRNFENALPGIKEMRDALTHFDEWLRGTGYGQQKRTQADKAIRDVARDYAGFGYDPNNDNISFGPHTINIGVAEKAAVELCQAIYEAAHKVDEVNIRQLRNRTIKALEDAGIRSDIPNAEVKISPGTDLRIWLSLNPTADADNEERRKLSERVVAALAKGCLHLESNELTKSSGLAERLTRGHALRVEVDAETRPLGS